MRRLALTVALLGAAPFAFASCPPMSAYAVTGVSAESVPVKQAMDLLFAGTAWKVDVLGSATGVNVSYRGVSGPLDQVLAKVIKQVGSASAVPISAISDANRCLVTLSVLAAPESSAPAVSGAATDGDAKVQALNLLPITLRAGENLSAELERYVRARGWSMRWNTGDDYIIDVPIAMPRGDVIEAVTWLVRTYQAQGGMEGVVPRFAKGNKVVVIEQMDVRGEGQ